jgi:hypothetical protein
MGSHDIGQVIAQLMLAVASFALGTMLVALHMTPLKPLPTVTQVYVAPAQVAGLARPAARPKLMVDEGEIVGPLQPKAFDDELPFFRRKRVNAALCVRLRQRLEEIAVEEIHCQGAGSPGVFEHGAERSTDKAVYAIRLVRPPIRLPLGTQRRLQSHQVIRGERRKRDPAENHAVDPRRQDVVFELAHVVFEAMGESRAFLP